MESSEKQGLPKWVFWSTRESIDNDIPSVTAVAETIVAVALYWGIAIHFETYLPLLISAAVAPLVLLRSDPSVRLGVKWFTQWTGRLSPERTYNELKLHERLRMWLLWALIILSFVAMAISLIRLAPPNMAPWLAVTYGVAAVWISAMIVIAVVMAVAVASAGAIWITLAGVLSDILAIIGVRAAGQTVSGGEVVATLMGLPFLFGVALSFVLVSLTVRIGATLRYLGAGIQSLPRNFRRLAFCTSPRQEPELVPGLSSDDTAFTLPGFLQKFNQLRKSVGIADKTVAFVLIPLVMLLWFLPGWLYRITLKSTIWFWWPLAFLGGDLRRAINPKRFQERIMGTLFAKASFMLAGLTILGFLGTHFVLSGTVAQSNPFLSVFGFVFLIDWRSIGIWQVLALASAVLSIVILFWIDIVRRDHAEATDSNDPELLAQTKAAFGWIERLARVRLLTVVAFWLIVAGHTLLLFNSYRCWFDVPTNVERWAGWIYDKRLPARACLEKSL